MGCILFISVLAPRNTSLLKGMHPVCFTFNLTVYVFVKGDTSCLFQLQLNDIYVYISVSTSRNTSLLKGDILFISDSV